MNEMKHLPLSRRQFIVKSSAVSGGLVLGVSLSGCASKGNTLNEQGDWDVDAWLSIRNDGQVVFVLDRVEMGQGTYTGLTTLIAEELDYPPNKIIIEFAGASQEYRNRQYGLQITGGSNSLASSWDHIRGVAAAAREMLLLSAVDVLETPMQRLTLSNGVVTDVVSGKQIPMQDLVSLASKQKVPEEPQLKKVSDFKYIGKHSARLDSQAKVLGTADFGIDVDVDGMVYAVVVHPPVVGTKALSHTGNALSSERGFIAVTEIETGVAIVASSYWAARKISEKLEVTWEDADKAWSSASVHEELRALIAKDDGEVVRNEGDVSEVFSAAKEALVELDFELPYLAHATMEPMNCVAHVQEHRADIWASTQGPDIAQVAVAKVTDLDLDEVFIHSKFIGGGFGRRLNQDFIGEAAEISYKIRKPVKLVWSREDDMRNDFYRPASAHQLKALVSESGQINAWRHHIAAQGVMDWYVWNAAPAMFPFAPKFMYPMLGSVGLATAGTPMTPADRSAYEGADDLEYEFMHQEIVHSKAEINIPVGYWRAVGHSHNGFVTEVFMDACAASVDMDPVAFRLQHLREHPRLAGVVRLAAEKGGWGKPAPKGRYRGIAAHKSFGSYVAELVELSVNGSEITVHSVTCAVDCGLVVNPDIVTMQMESCVVFGLTAALYGEVTFENGTAVQSNFHDYQMLRNNQCPNIDVHIVASEESPTGVGEPGLPPLAAAMSSALFYATGRRHTRLPFKLA